jgi:hypothetical protein
VPGLDPRVCQPSTLESRPSRHWHCQQTLLTATDALNPVGVSDHAWQNHPDEWKEKLFGNSLILRYAAPLFFEGRAWPVIRAEFQEEFMPSQRDYPWEEFKKFRAWKRVEAGDPATHSPRLNPWPVSVNVMDAIEGTYFQNSKPHSPEANWASFNIGEFFWPQDRRSLLPLAILWLFRDLHLPRRTPQNSLPRRAAAAKCDYDT